VSQLYGHRFADCILGGRARESFQILSAVAVPIHIVPFQTSPQESATKIRIMEELRDAVR
jgi:hypothetical protein